MTARRPLMGLSPCGWPFVKSASMDNGYSGNRVASAAAIHIVIVRKPQVQVDVAVHTRRWAVERFFTRIGRSPSRPLSPSSTPPPSS